MKCHTLWMGTPGALFSALHPSKKLTLVLLDRKADTWERVTEGEHRYAIWHPVLDKATTSASVVSAKAEIERLCNRGLRDLQSEFVGWK